LFSRYFVWLRLVLYILLASFSYFYFFIDDKNLSIYEKTTEVIKNIVEEKNILKVEACLGTCLVLNNKNNVWSVYDETTKVDFNYSFAVFENNSTMILNVDNSLNIYLVDDSIVSVNIKDGLINLEVKDYCVYFNTKKDKSIFYLENIKQEISISGLSSYCYADNALIAENIPDKIKNINLLINNYRSFEDNYKLFLPCNDTIELVNSDTVDLNFSFLAPVLGTKVFQISNDRTFASLNSSFNIKDYYNYSVKLSKGMYYWRIKNTNNTKISERCEFIIDTSTDIVLNTPKNFAAYNSGPIKFSYQSSSISNEILISKDWDFSSIVFSTKQNNYNIDDPLQTLGSGTFYYKVVNEKGLSSLSRKFFILTDSDIVVLSPKDKEQFKSRDNFINIKWSSIVNIKNYVLMVSKDSNFNNIVYSLDTKVPFAYLPNLNDGEYYYRINAILEDGIKLTSQTYTYIVSDAKYVNLIEPKDELEYFISINKDFVPLTWLCDYDLKEINHKLIINQEILELENIIKKENKCYYKLKDNLKPYNNIVLKFYCKDSECLKSRAISFYTKKDLSPRIIVDESLNAIELDIKSLARIAWTKTSDPVEYEIFDVNKNFIRNGTTDRGFLLIKIEPGLYFIRLREAGKNISGYQEFKIIEAKPGVPVIQGPSNRYVAKSNVAVKFSWNKTIRAEYYELRIYDKNKTPIIKKTKDLELSLKLKKGNYTWELYSYIVEDDRIRYSNPSKKRILIVN